MINLGISGITLYPYSIAIYTVLFTLMVYLSYLAKNNLLFFYISLIIYAFIFGIRHNVGVDYLSYLEIYNTGGENLERLEFVRRRQEVVQIRRQKVVQTSFQGV